MDVSYINPFVEAVNSVFETMLGVHPTRNQVKISCQKIKTERLTSLIGISGVMHGVVALTFPPQTALDLTARMLETNEPKSSEEIVDAISELVNMVAGSAKAKFNTDPPLELGLPTVVEGSGYRVKYPSKSVWLEIQFNSDAGEFSMEITYSPN
ncbi:MAG: chemotaxis protein CheX [Planctomycetota bacterium]